MDLADLDRHIEGLEAWADECRRRLCDYRTRWQDTQAFSPEYDAATDLLRLAVAALLDVKASLDDAQLQRQRWLAD